jgi:hypothetical protein
VEDVFSIIFSSASMLKLVIEKLVFVIRLGETVERGIEGVEGEGREMVDREEEGERSGGRVGDECFWIMIFIDLAGFFKDILMSVIPVLELFKGLREGVGGRMGGFCEKWGGVPKVDLGVWDRGR